MELLNRCDFSEVFDECKVVPGSLSSHERPVKEVGYIRADYDGRRWWTTYFPQNDLLKTKALSKEINEVMNELFEIFPDLHSLREYCHSGRAAKKSEVEYDCFINNKHGNYWIRLLTLPKNYNIYCHIYIK